MEWLKMSFEDLYLSYFMKCLIWFGRFWCHWRRAGVFIVNFEHISHIFLVFLFLAFRMYLFAGIVFLLLLKEKMNQNDFYAALWWLLKLFGRLCNPCGREKMDLALNFVNPLRRTGKFFSSRTFIKVENWYSFTSLV